MPVDTDGITWWFFFKPLKVRDGDTIEGTLDFGFRLRWDVAVRVLGVNSPEMSTGAPGEAAKQFTEGWVLRPSTYEWPTMLITRKEKDEDQYGRVLASVEWRETGERLEVDLVSSGNAVIYHRGVS